MQERNSLETDFIIPDWPAQSNIKSLATTRLGGFSKHPYNSLNLAGHVNDSPDHVAANRALLKQQGKLPAGPSWLQQVHGTAVVNARAGSGPDEVNAVADGSVCDVPNIVCAVQTADCLPLLVTTKSGKKVGALHAGWRGLTSGIVESGIKAMGVEPGQLMFWMGPAIGPDHFEVGEDVLQAFEQRYKADNKIFTETGEKKWHMNIYQAARQVLSQNGVQQVYGGDFCTFTDEERFFSYRRDGICGRMASLIWMDI
jgi:YfiH family protein